jgi:hypothetical protein
MLKFVTATLLCATFTLSANSAEIVSGAKSVIGHRRIWPACHQVASHQRLARRSYTVEAARTISRVPDLNKGRTAWTWIAPRPSEQIGLILGTGF